MVPGLLLTSLKLEALLVALLVSPLTVETKVDLPTLVRLKSPQLSALLLYSESLESMRRVRLQNCSLFPNLSALAHLQAFQQHL